MQFEDKQFHKISDVQKYSNDSVVVQLSNFVDGLSAAVDKKHETPRQSQDLGEEERSAENKDCAKPVEDGERVLEVDNGEDEGREATQREDEGDRQRVALGGEDEDGCDADKSDVGELRNLNVCISSQLANHGWHILKIDQKNNTILFWMSRELKQFWY